jgi:hypothetical protein
MQVVSAVESNQKRQKRAHDHIYSPYPIKEEINQKFKITRFVKGKFLQIECFESLNSPKNKEDKNTDQIQTGSIESHSGKQILLSLRHQQAYHKTHERYPNHELNPG